LLRADHTSTLTGGSQLGDVDGDLSRTDTDRETVDEATDDEHTDVLGSADEDGTDDPDDATNLDGALATEHIRERTRDESTEERTARHGSRDTTLG
jgi:hypothetical protein